MSSGGGSTKGGRKSPAQQRPATKSPPPPPVQQQIQDIPQQQQEQPIPQQQDYQGEAKGQRPQAPVQQQQQPVPQAPVKGRSPGYQQQQPVETPQQNYGGGSSGKKGLIKFTNTLGCIRFEIDHSFYKFFIIKTSSTKHACLLCTLGGYGGGSKGQSGSSGGGYNRGFQGIKGSQQSAPQAPVKGQRPQAPQSSGGYQQPAPQQGGQQGYGGTKQQMTPEQIQYAGRFYKYKRFWNLQINSCFSFVLIQIRQERASETP